MSRPKRYAYISVAESTACEAAFERMEAAWQSGDVEQIAGALDGLKGHFIYSTYPWYKRWNELKPQVVCALWHGWPRERFWNLESNQNLSSWEFRTALEPIAEELSENDLKELCQRYDFPTAHSHPRLLARLVEEPGAEFSRWLIDKIKHNLKDEGRLKATQTHSPKSSFRVFHWQPFKPEVARPIEILSRRRDEVAHGQTRQWLRELPFANDRSSVEGLLRGALDNSYSELESDLEAALDLFSLPTNLRLLLFEWLEKLNPSVALDRFFADLRAPMGEEACEAYLQFIESKLSEWKTENEPLLLGEMALVDCRRWSVFMRGYWASIAKRGHLPISCKAGVGTCLVDGLVRLFDDSRPFIWGGCLMGLPFLLLAGSILQTVMTLMWGSPSKQWMALNWVLTLVWATYVAATATFDIYHGGEARRTRFKMALCSFGSFTAMLGVGVISRVV